MSRLPCVILVLFVVSLASGSGGGETVTHAPHATLENVAVPMRDGTILRANVWLPKAEGRFPTLVYRTPYDKNRAPDEWTTFDRAVAGGYALVIQDVRGRYASDGQFIPYQNEGKDGYDTIEWAAKQPWSDGNVGTFGLSYPGAVQWLAAVEAPPHLKAMVPAMTYASPRRFFYMNGVFDGSWLDWIWMNIAPDARKRKNLPGPQTYAEAKAAWKAESGRIEGFLPLKDLPDLKQATPFYYEWLNHAPAEAWWDWAELEGKYGRVKCAVLNFSGWYDEAYGPDGATTNFNGLLEARKDWKDPATRTIIGPWTHGGEDEQKSGQRDFGPTAPVDYDGLIVQWMDHYLLGKDNGAEYASRVRLFVMGTNAWRDEAEWPLKRAATQSLYLTVQSAAERVGKLSATAASDSKRSGSFASDPAHPLSDPDTSYGAHDYRALAGREDTLTFDTEPFAKDLEVTGPLVYEIYASADVEDFDLWVRIQDVAPDGTAFNLMSPGLDVLRASYRDHTVEPHLLQRGKVYRLQLDHMVTSNAFLKGHRLRVQLSGNFYPHGSRNLQTGKSEIDSSQMKAGRITIHQEPGQASRLLLPVVEGVSQSKH